MAKNTQNIFQTVRIFYYFLKTMGLATYKLDVKSCIISTSIWNYFEVIAFILLTLEFTRLEAIGIQEDLYSSGSQSKLLEAIWKYQYILQHLFIVIVIISNFTRRKSIEGYLRQIYKFDKKVEQLGFQYKSKESIILILILTMSGCLAYATYQYLLLYVFEVYEFILKDSIQFSHVKYFGNIFVMWFYVTLPLQSIFSIYAVNNRLKILTKNARFVN